MLSNLSKYIYKHYDTCRQLSGLSVINFKSGLRIDVFLKWCICLRGELMAGAPVSDLVDEQYHIQIAQYINILLQAAFHEADII